jgi:hypothetical protein
VSTVTPAQKAAFEAIAGIVHRAAMRLPNFPKISAGPLCSVRATQLHKASQNKA